MSGLLLWTALLPLQYTALACSRQQQTHLQPTADPPDLLHRFPNPPLRRYQTDRYPDGQLPSDEELAELDGFILSGDKCVFLCVGFCLEGRAAPSRRGPELAGSGLPSPAPARLPCRGSLPDNTTDRVLAMIRRAADNGTRILG